MTDTRRPRKPYTPPTIRQVRLIAEEAVLAACKTSGGVRSWGNKCDNHQGKCINRIQGS
ncbi:MAG: hypothetical protein AB1568_11825 [Thermodesulfobacteriota bacterium]